MEQSEVNYNCGLATNLMNDIGELKENRNTLNKSLSETENKLDKKTIELSNLLFNLGKRN